MSLSKIRHVVSVQSLFKFRRIMASDDRRELDEEHTQTPMSSRIRRFSAEIRIEHIAHSSPMFM